LTIAVGAFATFEVSSGSFERALSAWTERDIAGDLIVTPAGAAAGGATTFGGDALVRARATPGVRAVAALRTVHTRSGATDVTLRGDDDFAPSPKTLGANPPSPQEENTPAPAEVSSGLAAALHVARGDALEIRAPHRDVRLRVAAVRPDFSGGRGDIVVARRFVREAFGDDGIDALRVTIAPHADPTTVRTALARSLAPERVTIVTARELRERLASVFAGTFTFARALGIVVVAIAVFGIASALAAIVFERRFELRMLRRIGASRGTIATMLFLESFTIASCASVLGLFLGLALAAVILEASDPVTLGFALPMHVPTARIALALLASIAAGTLGTLFSLPAAFRIATDGSREGAA
jgi:putative ABC transport system permease protein